MLESVNHEGKLDYQKLTAEECEKRGILGRLVGKVADWQRSTRNGRKYGIDLWEKVFNSPIMKEKIENKVAFGELGHPEDRSEIDMEKIAVCLAEQPKKGKDGFLYAVFDILSTPNGKLLKTLCDYGCNVGVSSRGSGDVYTDADGNEAVDPDTYECECFDIVLIPAVKEARLQYVTESLDKSNKKTLNESLKELVESSNDEGKKVLTETLKELELDYSDAKADNIQSAETEVKSEKEDTANDDGVALVEELQRSLKANKELTKQIAELQEKLSVCYAKENSKKESEVILESVQTSLNKSEKSNKLMQTRISMLVEELKTVSKENEELQNEINSMRQSIKADTNKTKLISENLSNSKNTIIKLREELESVKSDAGNAKKELMEKLNNSKETIADLKKDLVIKESEFNKRLSNEHKLVEKYKSQASLATNKYIECRAKYLGINAVELRERLGSKTTFEEIDKMCESLHNRTIISNKLPFPIESKKVKFEVTEPENTLLPTDMYDDTVDEQLLSMMGK